MLLAVVAGIVALVATTVLAARAAAAERRRTAGRAVEEAKALAIAIRCRWPPESAAPRSATELCICCGSSATNSHAPAAHSAASTSASFTSGSPSVTFHRTVSCSRKDSCGT